MNRNATANAKTTTPATQSTGLSTLGRRSRRQSGGSWISVTVCTVADGTRARIGE
jgi:hypothetical protein